MTAITSGAILGLTCAILVAIFGLIFIRTKSTTGFNFGERIREFARGILGIVSVVLIVVGLITAIFANGLPFFTGWLGAYAIGLFAYFFVRYGVLKRS